MAKTVLITGSNGLLGQKLIDLYLAVEDVNLIATGSGPNRYPHSQGYQYISLDITDHNAVREILLEFSPQCIIHTAAMTNVDACETDIENCRKLNVDAVKNLAILSAEFNIHLIHLSTDFIFDGKGKMYSEEEEAFPLSVYGQSKLDAEKMVQQYATNWSIVRTAIVYGYVGVGGRGNIVLWAIKSLQSGAEINVVNDQFRTPTLAEDLAMGCRLIEAQNAQGVFHICGEDFMNIYEMVQRVAVHLHCSMEKVNIVSSESLNQPAKRPPVTGLSIEKAKKQLGYKPHSFQEGLEMVLRQLGK